MIKQLALSLVVLSLVVACKAQKPPEQKKPAHVVLIKPKPKALTADLRGALQFPAELISQIELAAGAEAEPFYTTVLTHSVNLIGDEDVENRKLAGFSVRTKNADDLVERTREELRKKGFLIFKTSRRYSSVAETVSVVRGKNSFELLRLQGTEAPNYNLDAKAITLWLKNQQQTACIVVGAGPDWVEVRFKRPPQNMLSFARKVAAFAPDVLEHGQRTPEELVERMQKMNGFVLVWD